MRPMLHPSLSRVWRDPFTLQIGITANRAVVLGNLGSVERSVLGAMDGRTDLSTLRELAAAAGGCHADADRLIGQLLDAGVAVDQQAVDAGAAISPRFEPDRASVALVDGGHDAGHQRFTKRRSARATVIDAGRVGAAVARLLAAGGIGNVDVDDAELVTPADVSPSGHAASAIGLTRQRSLRPWLEGDDHAEDGRSEPDIVVLTSPTTGQHVPFMNSLTRSGVPHLQAYVLETTGTVGPLVVPGESACLRCVELHRADRDRHWPAILDQAERTPPASPACDASLATTVAALAASHVLSFLDGYDVATVGGTVEIELPAGLPRRRSWPVHPDCGCAWSRDADPIGQGQC